MLTVLMPVFNAMPYLPEAIHSVLKQSIEDFRLLLLDGGSSDGSLDYMHSVDDPRLEIAAFPRLGLGASLDHGFNVCSTPYFARMDADDRCSPDRFERQLGLLEADRALGMVGTQFAYFGTSGKGVRSPTLPCDHEAIVAGLYRKSLTLVHGSLVGRTDVVKRAGGYRVFGMGEDWDMFLRVGEVSRLANLPETLYFWRLHPHNATLPHLMEQQIGLDYACQCAARRRAGLPEPDFASFKNALDRETGLKKLRRHIDTYALGRYRIGLSKLSRGEKLGGYTQLAWGAACSPGRSFRRVRRSLLRR